ncbi:hypothetical protein ACVW1C_005553 [Bradyrhizobium sp. USDA 4011]
MRTDDEFAVEWVLRSVRFPASLFPSRQRRHNDWQSLTPSGLLLDLTALNDRSTRSLSGFCFENCPGHLEFARTRARLSASTTRRIPIYDRDAAASKDIGINAFAGHCRKRPSSGDAFIRHAARCAGAGTCRRERFAANLQSVRAVPYVDRDSASGAKIFSFARFCGSLKKTSRWSSSPSVLTMSMAQTPHSLRTKSPKRASARFTIVAAPPPMRMVA